MQSLIKEAIQLKKMRDEANRKYVEAILSMKTADFKEMILQHELKLTYNTETLINYDRLLSELGENGILLLHSTVKENARYSELIVHRLLESDLYTPMQKKLRMNALIFLFNKMHEETASKVSRLKMPPVLAKIGPKKSKDREAATHEESMKIIEAARSVNLRDSLVLELIYYTKQPLQAVLALKCKEIDFDTRIILNKNIDEDVIERLKAYVEDTQSIREVDSFAFITRQGKPIFRTQIQKILEKVNKSLQLPFAITTKMIQRSQESETITIN